MIKVIDDVISKKYQDEIEKLFLGSELPWHFNPTLTSTGIGKAIGFGHPFTIPNHKSPFYDYVLPLSYEIAKKANVEMNDVLFARAFLQVPSTVSESYDIFHVDLMTNHMVFLYYVNDSDGDTVICDKIYEAGNINVLISTQNINIIKTVTPKKGRALIFNGKMYHAAGIPKKNIRCTLNFDISTL